MLFFALSGLRTHIDLLSGRDLWLYTLAIPGTAIVGKLAGATIASRFARMTWRESIALGVLLNTRGLVELIILIAGLDLGILEARLYRMMVIMALVTTLMTTPVLRALKLSPQPAEPTQAF